MEINCDWKDGANNWPKEAVYKFDLVNFDLDILVVKYLPDVNN